MRIVAFDLSLTCTGVATGDGGHELIIPPKGLRGIERLRSIRHAVRRRSIDADLVVIEGYAFAAHASHAHELGELGGVVRVGLADANIAFVDVPPASLKLFATGRGNAKKEEVLAAAIRKLGYDGHSTDEADAMWLREMAICQYEQDVELEHHQRALAKVPWPASVGAPLPDTPARVL